MICTHLFRHINGSLTGITTASQTGHESNGNEGVFITPGLLTSSLDAV